MHVCRISTILYVLVNNAFLLSVNRVLFILFALLLCDYIFAISLQCDRVHLLVFVFLHFSLIFSVQIFHGDETMGISSHTVVECKNIFSLMFNIIIEYSILLYGCVIVYRNNSKRIEINWNIFLTDVQVHGSTILIAWQQKNSKYSIKNSFFSVMPRETEMKWLLYQVHCAVSPVREFHAP